MKKRTIKIGIYDTASHGWTLTGCKLSDPEPKTNYVEKTGGDGAWDLSTVMTNGLPRYKNRSLTVTLECSRGTRATRERLINEMVNTLDGLEWQIVLPDRPDHYLTGRIRVAVDYSNLAHAAVTITGICEPWLYSARETVVEHTVGTVYGEIVDLINHGRRAVVPTIEANTAAGMTLLFNGNWIQITEAGTYKWPTVVLTNGKHEMTVTAVPGDTLKITYREAVLR